MKHELLQPAATITAAFFQKADIEQALSAKDTLIETFLRVYEALEEAERRHKAKKPFSYKGAVD